MRLIVVYYNNMSPERDSKRESVHNVERFLYVNMHDCSRELKQNR